MRTKWEIEGLYNELQDPYNYHFNEITEKIKGNKKNKDISISASLLAILEKQRQLLEWVLELRDDPY